MSSHIRVGTRGVAKHAQEIIILNSHRDALAADQIIDRLMTRKTWFTKKPVYATRDECIKDNLYTNSPLSRALAPSPQMTRCQQLLLAAYKCVDDHMSLDVDDLSSLGIGASSLDEYTRVVWDKLTPRKDEA
jgi:hypothetical protein